jgi:hypothetical protein
MEVIMEHMYCSLIPCKAATASPTRLQPHITPKNACFMVPSQKAVGYSRSALCDEGANLLQSELLMWSSALQRLLKMAAVCLYAAVASTRVS